MEAVTCHIPSSQVISLISFSSPAGLTRKADQEAEKELLSWHGPFVQVKKWPGAGLEEWLQEWAQMASQ